MPPKQEMWVQIPCLPLRLWAAPSLPGSMVKWTSCRASNPAFQVRVLVELLSDNSRKGHPMGDGSWLEAGRAPRGAMRVRLPLLPLNPEPDFGAGFQMVFVVSRFGMRPCEGRGGGFDSPRTPLFCSKMADVARPRKAPVL